MCQVRARVEIGPLRLVWIGWPLFLAEYRMGVCSIGWVTVVPPYLYLAAGRLGPLLFNWAWYPRWRPDPARAATYTEPPESR